nr:terminase family protein [Actinoplanes rectilineatus]
MSIAHANARINIWTGAVRSGKTIASLLRWLIYVSNAPRGGQLMVGAKTLDTCARNVFGPLMDPAITGDWAKRIHYTRGAPTANILGRTVEVITANDARAEERLRGMTCAGAYIDEATLVPEAYWNQLLARLSVPGAKLFATTNPDNPAHWLRKKFMLRVGELDLRWWQFQLEDNESLDPAYVASLKKEYVGLWYKRFIDGAWVVAEGAVYDMWDPERHVIDLIPPIWRWICTSIDYGTSNPFHGLLLGIDASQTVYVASEWRHAARETRRSMTDAEYSTALLNWQRGYKRIPADLPGVVPESTVVDPSAASFIQQLYRDGVTPTPADNGVADGIRTVAGLLGHDKLKVHRSCKHLIDEFPGYSWDEKKARKGEDAPIKVDDHGLDAVRYGVKTTEGTWRRPNGIQYPHRPAVAGEVDLMSAAM